MKAVFYSNKENKINLLEGLNRNKKNNFISLTKIYVRLVFLGLFFTLI